MKRIYLLLLLAMGPITAQNIAAVEYFIDNDPGFGNATPVANVPQNPDVHFAFNVAQAMTSGTHVVGYRTKDADGIWSLTAFTTFNVIENLGTSTIQSLEYFWDADAGFGNNSIYNLTTPQANVQNLSVTLDVPANLTLGDHSVFVRSRDARAYSHVNYRLDVLATDSFAKSGIAFYPNPVQDQLNVRLDSGNARLIVYDLNARKVVDTTVNQTDQIDLSHLSSGVYTAYFWKEAHTIQVVKLIKQ